MIMHVSYQNATPRQIKSPCLPGGAGLPEQAVGWEAEGQLGRAPDDPHPERYPFPLQNQAGLWSRPAQEPGGADA